MVPLELIVDVEVKVQTLEDVVARRGRFDKVVVLCKKFPKQVEQNVVCN